MRSLLMLTVLLLGGAAFAQDAPPEKTAAAPASGEAQAGGDAKAAQQPVAADQAKSEGESPAPAEPSAVGGMLRDMLNSGAMGYMLEGGFFMWPILLMGVVAGGVIIERWRSLKMLTTDTTALRNQVQDLLQADRVEEALQLCDREQGPVPAVLTVGLRKYLVLKRLNYEAARIEEQVVKAMDDYSVHIVAALERHLPVLATVSSAAPMVGFLGTVQGMIVSFRDIVAQMGEKNIVESAASGIQVALLTTCFGLIVGIPAYVAYNYFTSLINAYVLEVEESATELIETVTLQTALQAQEDNLSVG